MSIPPNTRLSHYTIRRLLGKGGMGEVYLAEDVKLGRPVALKLLPADCVQKPERLHRFEREAYAASSLNHPNILTIYEVAEADGHHFIAAEYVEGENLCQRQARAPMTLGEILGVAWQVASALTAAHGAGVVHRDIKPENIMLRGDGYVKVLDFGLAKLTDGVTQGRCFEVDRAAATRTLNYTSPGAVMGTVAYMSPEQARGTDVDFRSDIWSLGAMLYELVAGRPPFDGETPNDIIASILKSEPPPLSSLTPGVPPQLERAVAKMLSKDHGRRYLSHQELLADLQALRRQVESAAHDAQPAPAGVRAGAGPAEGAAATTPSAGAGDGVVSRTRSSAQHFVGGIRRHRVGASFVLAALVAIFAVTSYFTYSTPQTQVINSVAVLPFANDSGDQGLDYLSDGLSESVIDSLSQLPQLKVISRSSSFKFKGKDAEPQEIGNALGVQALVVGRVAQQGGSLQVGVELVDARDKTRIWGTQYVRAAADMQTIHAEIAQAVSGSLRVRLSREEQRRVADSHTEDTEAYQLYLKGRFSWNKLTEADVKRSIDYYNEALAKDPDFALAYAGLANSYLMLGANYLPPQETYPKASSLAGRALELDDTLAEAHYAMAVTKYYYNWDLPATEKELNRTLELKPNYAAAYSLLSHLNLSRGRTDAAISHLKRALEIDPFSLVYNTNLSYAFYFARRYDLALERMKKTLEMEPAATFLYSDMGLTYALMGRYEEALIACQRATILMGESPSALSSLGINYALWGKRAEAEWVVEALQRTAKKKYVQPYDIAAVYSALGQKDKAFEWLVKSFDERSGQLSKITVDPRFDTVRSDPRYSDLLRRMNLR